jgi:hypothetical protein
MAKPLRLAVAVVILEVLVLLGSIIPRQLQQALAVSRARALSRNALLARIAQEVEVETSRLRFVLAEQRHAEHLLVELERLLGVLDPQHGVVLPYVRQTSPLLVT